MTKNFKEWKMKEDEKKHWTYTHKNTSIDSSYH